MSATRSRSACDLGHAEGGSERLHLPVDVRFGDVVEVDQRQRGDAAARERLGRPGADAAERHDRDARGTQTLVGRVAVQAAQRSEAAFQVGLHRRAGVQRLRSTRQAW